MKKKTKPKYRSGFEQRCAEQLGSDFKYESLKFKYVVEKTYTPDFVNEKTKTIIEAKGVFRNAGDRAKLIAIKKLYPDWKLLLWFQAPDQLMPRTKLTYRQWAKKHGFDIV